MQLRPPVTSSLGRWILPLAITLLALVSLFAILIALIEPGPATIDTDEAAFPEATPEAVGLSSDGLAYAVRQVEEWIAEDAITGAILILIRDGKLVLHEALGLDDRDHQVPMRKDQIVLMRSMTKPLIGTATMMLAEEGLIAIHDPVSRYLPAWDTPESGEITIFQLLTHTSGITGGIAIRSHPDLQTAIAAVGQRGPSHPPGTRYHYADANSSTLGAIVEVVSGIPARSFVETRILEPLGMRDSYINDVPDHDRRLARTAAGYRGSAGDWRIYWQPGNPPRTPWWGGGAGGLYASGLDYARFAAMLLNGGELGGVRLLSEESVAEMLKPHSSYVYSEDELREVDQLYGFQIRLESMYAEQYDGNKAPGVFGHGGKEGTLFWVDPELDLIGLVLTQNNCNPHRRIWPRYVYQAILDHHNNQAGRSGEAQVDLCRLATSPDEMSDSRQGACDVES